MATAHCAKVGPSPAAQRDVTSSARSPAWGCYVHQECALGADSALDEGPRAVEAKVQTEARHLWPMLIVGMVNGKTLKP